MQKLAPLMVGLLSAWLSVAHAQQPDYIIQSNAAPLKPLVELPGPAAVQPVAAPAAVTAPAAPVAPQTPEAAAPANSAVAPVASVAAPQPESVPAPAAAPVDAASAVSGAAVVAAAVAPQEASGVAEFKGKVRIGLLLPTESKTFGDAAQVVRAGFEAAASVDGRADVVYVDEQLSDVAGRYLATVKSGVRVMVGPLTRQGIAAVAPYVTVPTLTLNGLDPSFAPNPKLLSLSLIVEGEARQMARLMRDDGRNSPLVLRAGDVLSRRLAQAFADEWRQDTGVAPTMIDWPVSAPLTAALAQADAVFVAMGPGDAAALKAAVPPTMAVYATSQVNTRIPDPALAGIRFIDMPWFLMTEQAEVKHYPRPSATLTLQTERLYALGIDAYRLAVQMATTKWSPGSLRLHGVTGDLKLGRDRQFERILPLAVMMANGAK